MTAVTWTTAPIPAYKLVDGDRVYHNGLTRAVEAVTPVDGGRIMFMHGIYGQIAEPDDKLMVEVPDEPVDGYNLWRPKPTTWVSGCICVHRRHPSLVGNWEQVSWDTNCPEHGIHDQYED